MSQTKDELPSYMREHSGAETYDSDEEVEIGQLKTHPRVDYAQYVSTGKGLASSARVAEDGRIVINLNLKKQLPDLPHDYNDNFINEFAVDPENFKQVPPMRIVIMIVGSRGDVQPFLALGQELVKYGHRVRIATHEAFRSFVKEAKLEFFAIGGDPHDLMSYMVRNPGLIPGIESISNGDIGKKRKMLGEILAGCWNSCFHPDRETGKRFAPDAIISNPPAFAHIHCAEALGIPLLLSFTMPWCATTAFPHPLVNVKESNAEYGLTNYLSYALADMMTWQGLGDVINKFRRKLLSLEPLSFASGPGVTDRLKIPWTYCFSPELVPKPHDWKNHIDVVGFYFLDLAKDYKPDPELVAFLAAGPPPIYIGFGSVVVEDPAKMTKTIFDAVAETGVRALVSAGWGGLGSKKVPKNVFILGNVPHDWLFTKVAAVCHHGGAGTTAIGLRLGKPTIVVPFFGDQPFWGMMIHKAGAGPKPIPHTKLETKCLADAIRFAMSPEAQAAAEKMGQQIRSQNGVQQGVDSFHRHLPILNMRCDLDPSRLAVWWSNEYVLKLSAFSAQVLADARKIDMNKLQLHRPKEYETRKAATDPVTGGTVEIFRTVTHYYSGIAQIFYSPVKGIVNTSTAIPRGVVEIIASIQEGFQRAPALYGSKVRKQGTVDDFASGVKEAGKGLFWGYYDGITGLVREPYHGARKEGFAGFIKGSARSYVNVTMRPAAGIVGLVAHPMRGAWKSIQGMTVVFAKQEHNQNAIRRADGLDDVKESTPNQRKQVIEAFEAAKEKTAERRRILEEIALKILEEEGSEGDKPTDKETDHIDKNKNRASGSGAMDSNLISADWESEVGSLTRPRPEEDTDEETARFERDLEMAKRLSLADLQKS